MGHSEKIYEQEMQHGHIDLGIDKVVMFGVAGRGKTCSLHALLGLPPPDPGSTELMERPITISVISSDDGKQWKKMTSEEVHERIAQIIGSRPVISEHTSERTSEHNSERIGEQPSNVAVNEPHPPTEGDASIAPEATVISPTVFEGEGAPGAKSMSELAQKLLSKMKKDFVLRINALALLSEPIYKQDWVYLIDSGGQQEFHEVLPIFLNGASDFIYVLKLDDPLDQPPELCFRDSSGTPMSKPHPSFLTNEQILKHCMHTINSFTTKNEDRTPPQILILGTHRDKVKKEELPQKLKAVNKIVKQTVEDTVMKDQVIFCGKQYVFPINAKEPEEEDMECAKKCQEILNEKHGRKRKPVPLRWYALQYMWQEATQELKRNVLSKQECLDIAKSLHIDNKSCEEALIFFNALNLLFYWPEILPDLVFVETKVILDKVSELVKKCYEMKENPSPTGGEWHAFLDYAKVTEARLKLFTKHYVDQMFTPGHLIDLLKGLLIIAKLPNDEWFMPSLLKMVRKDKVEDYRVNSKTALVVHFPNCRPLTGVFCCMVAFVLSPDNTYNDNPCLWRVLKDDGDEDDGEEDSSNEDDEKSQLPTRNVIKFHVEGFPGYVTMIDYFTHFEVHVHVEVDTKEKELWQLVRHSVIKGLKEASNMLGYTDNIFQLAIVCSHHPRTPHPAIVNGRGMWTCSKNKAKGGEVPLLSIPWWRETIPGGKKYPLTNLAMCHMLHAFIWLLHLPLLFVCLLLPQK